MKKYKVPPIPKSIWRNPLHFIAFGFGTGAIPVAPGTFGTLMAIPIYLLMQPLPKSIYFIVLTVFTLFCMWLCEKVSRDIKVHDHQGMCIDEFPGFLLTMFAVPFHLIWIIIGFILFRVFDIWKPFPIRYVDAHVKGGFGMVLDDLLAGVYSWIVLQILIRIISL
jgi:phosphatidylglycerophosphatase A